MATKISFAKQNTVSFQHDSHMEPIGEDIFSSKTIESGVGAVVQSPKSDAFKF